MARYDERINQLLGEFVLAERNRNPRNTDGVPARKGAEQHFDKDEPEDEDAEETAGQKKYGGDKGDKYGYRFNKKTGRKSEKRPYGGKHGNHPDEGEESLKETIEGIGLGGMMGMGGTGIKHAPPGWSFVDEDENETADKTGHLSDRELLAAVKKKGTAGPALLKRARSEIRKHKSISSETRDALARDAYASWAENEERPSAGLSKKKKSAVAKKARAGGDIGKKGKGFDKVAKAAGGGEKGQKIAAAAMWKNVKR